jgi:hypothetical protein
MLVSGLLTLQPWRWRWNVPLKCHLTQWTMQHYIPVVGPLHNHCCDNLKSYKGFYVHALMMCPRWNHDLCQDPGLKSRTQREVVIGTGLSSWNVELTHYLLFSKIQGLIFSNYHISPNIRWPPIFPMRNSEKKVFSTKFSMSFSLEGCKVKGVKTILLRNNNLKILIS